MSPETNSDWLDALAGDDGARRAAATTELRSLLVRVLARGFGRQLSEGDIEDLAQDSLLKIHTKLDTFAGTSKFTTWASTVAVHAALDVVRRRRYEHVEMTEATRSGQLALAPRAANGVAEEQRDRVLRDAIRVALTDRQQEALLAELGGLPLMEVARRMGSSRGALYKLLHDARKRLRAHFDANGLTAEELLIEGEDMS